MDPVPILTVRPQSNESLMTEWRRPEILMVNSYVIEWKALNDPNSSLIFFENLTKNQTSYVISGTVYNICKFLSYSLSQR